MTPLATLQKYGLKTDVKSLASYLQWPEPLSLENVPFGEKTDIWGASFKFLCELAERTEQHTATIFDCISLLGNSGNNTKSIVLEKLRGIV